jgi:hypothetical protein
MRISIVILLLVSGCVISCRPQKCNNIPEDFGSYSNAIDFLNSTSFSLRDSVSLYSDGIPVSVNYYSCDRETGFFYWNKHLYTEQLYENVPLSIWKEFSRSAYKEDFYKSNIYGKCQKILILNYINKGQ